MALQAVEDQKERKVVVKRTRLIKVLEKNRKAHEKEYIEALAGYKEMAIGKLKQAFEDAKVKLDKNLKKGIESLKEFNPDDPRKSSDYLTLVEGINVELKVPRSFTNEYDTAIDMFHWDERDTIELTTAEFQCFVRDKWNWSRDFTSINMIYKSKSL